MNMTMQAVTAEARQREEARTVQAIADYLNKPGCLDFPDHPVTADGVEVPWRACDVAFTYARTGPTATPFFERWCAALPRGIAYVRPSRRTSSALAKYARRRTQRTARLLRRHGCS